MINRSFWEDLSKKWTRIPKNRDIFDVADTIEVNGSDDNPYDDLDGTDDELD